MIRGGQEIVAHQAFQRDEAGCRWLFESENLKRGQIRCKFVYAILHELRAGLLWTIRNCGRR